MALLVVALGLMGAARLSASALGHNKAAQIRLSATALAADYADRARLNVYGFDLGAYDIALNDDLDEEALDPTQADSNEADDLLAAQAVAAFDRNDFMRAVAATLPQGQAVVSTAAANARAMDVWLLWQEPQATSAPAQALVLVSQRNCPSGLAADLAAKVYCLYLRVQL